MLPFRSLVLHELQAGLIGRPLPIATEVEPLTQSVRINKSPDQTSLQLPCREELAKLRDYSKVLVANLETVQTAKLANHARQSVEAKSGRHQPRLILEPTSAIIIKW